MSREGRREVIERAALQLFAERGYAGTSMDELARRSGVSAPVLYDHFDSKGDLHRRLLERTQAELLAMWRESLAGDEPDAVRIPRSIEAWAAYVEANPYAARMYFRETTSDPDVAAAHRRIQREAEHELGAILGGERGGSPVALEMAAVTIRSALTGLAIWWADHPDVTREQIVATALAVVWTGLERTLTV